MEAGCRDALAEGPLGHPVTGLRVTLADGATHPKDSSELAFRTAGRLGLREALRASVMQLLEPVAEVTVTVPSDAVGGVLGDLAARRGHVVDSAVRAGTAVVTAIVPVAELFGYASRLRSRTQAGAPSPPGQPATPRHHRASADETALPAGGAVSCGESVGAGAYPAGAGAYPAGTGRTSRLALGRSCRGVPRRR